MRSVGWVRIWPWLIPSWVTILNSSNRKDFLKFRVFKVDLFLTSNYFSFPFVVRLMMETPWKLFHKLPPKRFPTRPLGRSKRWNMCFPSCVKSHDCGALRMHMKPDTVNVYSHGRIKSIIHRKTHKHTLTVKDFLSFLNLCTIKPKTKVSYEVFLLWVKIMCRRKRKGCFLPLEEKKRKDVGAADFV